MECKARITNIARGLTNGYVVTLDLESAGVGDLQKLQDKDLTLILKRYSERRGKNANAYFHLLVGKIAEVVGRSPAWVKNDLIAECGYKEMIGDEPATIKTNLGPEVMMEQELLHTKICKVSEGVFFYYVYRPSHLYNKLEMSRLIDLTVMRAEELDIETMTPSQIERLKQLWHVNQES